MVFDSEEHTYIRKGIYYTSVTDVIDNFCKDFKKDRISKAIARKENRSQEEVLEEWDLKREISTSWGDAFHKSAELWIKYKQKPNQELLQDFIDKLDKEIKRDRCMTEEIVYNDRLAIAGTIDVVEMLSEGERGSYKGDVRLIDIKTNNGFDKSYNNLLKPFNKLKDTKLNRYRMQLTVYKELLERLKEVKVKDMEILQVGFDKEIEINRIKVKPIKGMIEAIEELDLKKIKVEKDYSNNIL